MPEHIGNALAIMRMHTGIEVSTMVDHAVQVPSDRVRRCICNREYTDGLPVDLLTWWLEMERDPEPTPPQIATHAMVRSCIELDNPHLPDFYSERRAQPYMTYADEKLWRIVCDENQYANWWWATATFARAMCTKCLLCNHIITHDDKPETYPGEHYLFLLAHRAIHIHEYGFTGPKASQAVSL